MLEQRRRERTGLLVALGAAGIHCGAFPVFLQLVKYSLPKNLLQLKGLMKSQASQESGAKREMNVSNSSKCVSRQLWHSVSGRRDSPEQSGDPLLLWFIT